MEEPRLQATALESRFFVFGETEKLATNTGVDGEFTVSPVVRSCVALLCRNTTRKLIMEGQSCCFKDRGTSLGFGFT